MRIMFFGTRGAFSAGALRGVLNAGHDVVGVVVATRRHASSLHRIVAGIASRVRPDPVAQLARRGRFPMWRAGRTSDAEVAAHARDAAPDLICVAGYPWILPPALLGVAQRGAVNIHPSLLPRHRGLLPLFWIYYHDDRETGVTAHRATVRPDAGPILAQAAFPLARGYPVDQLNARNAEAAADVAARAVATVAREASGRPQDDTLATMAPAVRAGTPMVDFAAWDVERVWHFLAGLWPRFREPLRDRVGRAVTYAGVSGYRRMPHDWAAGAVRVVRDGVELYCRGGVVDLRSARYAPPGSSP